MRDKCLSTDHYEWTKRLRETLTFKDSDVVPNEFWCSELADASINTDSIDMRIVN